MLGFATPHTTSSLNVLDLKAAMWATCAEPPLSLTGNARDACHSGRRGGRRGAYHLGRLFVLLFDSNEEESYENGKAPTVYTYAPNEDAWSLHPPLPKPKVDSKFSVINWHSLQDCSLTSCLPGIIVLDESGGGTALLEVVNGVITSVVTLCNECWSTEGVSAFAQDCLLVGLNVAAVELSADCKLLKDWAERIEEKQATEEELCDPHDAEEQEHGPLEVTNLREAMLWLEMAGLPSLEERTRRRHEAHESRLASMTEEAKQMEAAAGIAKILNWMTTGEMAP